MRAVAVVSPEAPTFTFSIFVYADLTLITNVASAFAVDVRPALPLPPILLLFILSLLPAFLPFFRPKAAPLLLILPFFPPIFSHFTFREKL